MKKTWFALSAVLALAACDRVADPVACPAYIPPSLNVTVQDSVTGANLTSGSTLVLRGAAGVVDSTTVETQPFPINSRGLGMGASGTFSLTVRHAGYREWTKSGIEVKQGQCGARTVDVEARLQPAP
ncbi:MAG TPA: hypothetical protein VFJ82_05040 [Longimicrobium sp.]|nr:hypothetical protein [Longimicrobium sp.]